VPARKNSDKMTAYGAYPGATVVPSVQDFVLGATSGTCMTSVITISHM